MLMRLHTLIEKVCPIHGIVLNKDNINKSEIQFKKDTTPDQQKLAIQILESFVSSDELDAEWELSQNRKFALENALYRKDDISIGIRAYFYAITHLINDRLEALGQPRVLEKEVLDYITKNPTIGDPKEK